MVQSIPWPGDDSDSQGGSGGGSGAPRYETPPSPPETLTIPPIQETRFSEAVPSTIRNSENPVVSPSPSKIGAPEALQLVRDKHKEYTRLSRLNCLTYYVTRTVAGLSSALLPFTVGSHPTIATTLAILVAIAVAMDSIYNPRARWQLFSTATDLLAVEQLKALGQYEQAKTQLELIRRTEAAKLEQLVDLREVVEKVKASH